MAPISSVFGGVDWDEVLAVRDREGAVRREPPAPSAPAGLPLLTAADIAVAKRVAFNRAANAVRERWLTASVDHVSQFHSPLLEPLRFAGYVALAAVIELCPDVAPLQLAQALGFDHPDQAVDMLPVKMRAAEWPRAHVRVAVAMLRRRAAGHKPRRR